MGLIISTPAAGSPVSLEEAREWLAFDDPVDDARLAATLDAATQSVQCDLERTLMPTTWDLTLESFPSAGDWIRLPQPPITAITKVDYVDVNGATQTWSSSNYVFDPGEEPSRLMTAYGVSWPAIRPGLNAVLVRYVAGYANAAAVPSPIKTAILMLTADMIEHPEAQSELRLEENKTIERLLSPLKIRAIV